MDDSKKLAGVKEPRPGFPAAVWRLPHGRQARARGAFTLLEILVVVLIITILATFVGVNVAREPGRAKAAKATAQIAVFRTALQLYRMDNGFYPSMRQGLQALCERPAVPPIPQNYREGGYLDSRNVPLDPWRNEYVYLVPGPDGAPYEIISYGADGQPGGEGEAADVRSSDI